MDKKNIASFNSQIKVSKNKFFVSNINNDLFSFSIESGNLIWKHSTEKPFISSSKKLSIILKNNLVVFSNSLEILLQLILIKVHLYGKFQL